MHHKKQKPTDYTTSKGACHNFVTITFLRHINSHQSNTHSLSSSQFVIDLSFFSISSPFCLEITVTIFKILFAKNKTKKKNN